MQFRNTPFGAAAAASMLCSNAFGQSAQISANPSADLDTIVVTGVRASLKSALDEKKNADQMQDSIVAEDIGKLPDNNVIEALQHVTGVQIIGEFGILADVSYIKDRYKEEILDNYISSQSIGPVPGSAGPGKVAYLPLTEGGQSILGNRERTSDNVSIQWSLNANTEAFAEAFYTRYRNPNLFLRFAASKTATHPQFSQLDPGLSLSASTATLLGSGTAGNPNLSPERSTNADLSLEYHAYDAAHDGRPTLRIAPLGWTDDNWPGAFA